jgi:serine/threonine protein phosphatase PrpC
MQYAAVGMQGWRRSMEDSHIANLNLGDGNSFFGVFDGHGGKKKTYLIQKKTYLFLFYRPRSCFVCKEVLLQRICQASKLQEQTI